ncbi:hypothetical protein VP91_00011510 [Candidatus Pelagibacter ubique]|uniref:Glycosyltransferase n=1 Tax=Pelagibacter ubique TaxID=198252 RepID=A0ABX1T353_PELUQ|nr:hypothetical protein [Candidatus Pelagibacter ubique]NMN67996.1 hypothetical protein [Candidatus Pelagibacter ubique]
MSKERLFVISCYFDGSNNAIFNCTNSILNNYNKPKIVVVDSDSPDKSYFDKLKLKSIEVLDAKNKNYDTGAYWIAFNKFHDYDNYYFLQDSIIIKENLIFYEKYSLTTFRYFLSINRVGGFIIDKTKKNFIKKLSAFFKRNKKIHDIYGYDYNDQITWSNEQLKKTLYFLPKTWLSVFGPIFLCKKHVMLNLIQKNFDKILPTNKIEQMCMERLFGIAFQQEGLDVSNSIQGENFNTKFDTPKFEKIFYKRK